MNTRTKIRLTITQSTAVCLLMAAIFCIILTNAVFAADPIPVSGSMKISLYGFVRFDAFYDQTEMFKGDWMLFAQPGNSVQAKQPVFSMGARATRTGLKLTGGEINSTWRTQALIEWDFCGGFPNSATAARQPILRLRHAWFDLLSDRIEIRFGQDWALISGPFPTTTNFLAGAGTGHLWMRYPQLKITWKQPAWSAALSFNRPMAGNIKYEDYAQGDFDFVGDGERTALPWIMGRLWWTPKPQTISVSGHYGQEKIADLAGNYHFKPSYSVNLDAVIGFKTMTMTGRYFTGENLNSFFGGVVQGYVADSSNVENIRSSGGFLQLTVNFNKRWNTTVGFGLDDPDDAVLKSGNRSRNSWQYINFGWNLSPQVSIMLGSDWMTTDYIAKPAGRNNRIQLVTLFKF